MNRLLFVSCLILYACPAVIDADEQVPDQLVSVNELMVSAITPATNTLWGVEDPQSMEDWQELEDAAIVVIASALLIREGGAGPDDDTWAADSAWQGFVADMIDAAIASRDAVRQRDLDALLSAGDVLYPPCEECHLQFHPDMQ